MCEDEKPRILFVSPLHKMWSVWLIQSLSHHLQEQDVYPVERPHPKHNVLLKASITSYFFRIFLVYQECNRALFHTDLLGIHFRTNMHYKGIYSFIPMSFKKNSLFCKNQNNKAVSFVSQIFLLFKKNFNSRLFVTALLDFLIFSIILVGNIIQETNLLYTKFNMSTGITTCWDILFCFLAF